MAGCGLPLNRKLKPHFARRKIPAVISPGRQRRGENCCSIDGWYRGPCGGGDVRNFAEPCVWRCALVRGLHDRGRWDLLELPVSDDSGMCAERDRRHARFL